MRKKLTALLLCGVMLTGLFAACGSGKPNESAKPATEAPKTEAAKPKEKVKIRFMAYNNESARKSWLAYLKEKLPNIDISYEFVKLDDFNNLLSSQLQAGQAADLIEVGGETRLLSKAGYLLDLTDKDFSKLYAESGTKAYTVDGKLYATPMQSWFEGIFYNKKIFKDNNLQVPKTLDQWIELHKTLKDKGIKPQTMGAQSWEPMMKQSIGVVNNLFYSDPANKSFDETFNTGKGKLATAWLPAVTEWDKMISSGCLDSSMLGMTYDQALDEFATGKAAMWESGPWAVDTIKQKNSSLDFGMFPIPGKEEGPGWLVGGPGSALAINAKSKNIDACLEILKATATPEAQAALIKDNAGSSFLKGVKSDLGPVYEDCQEAFAKGNVYAPWTSVWLVGNPVVESYGKSLQEVLAGSKTVEQALKDADEVNDNMLKTLK